MKRSILASTAALSLCLIAAFSTSACLQGAPLDEESEEAIKQARGCDMEAVFKKCGGSGCHEGDELTPIPYGGLDFSLPGFPTDLIGLGAAYEGVHNPEACPTTPELIIDPANPLQSLILKKVRGEQSCGDPMPQTLPLSPDQIQCLEKWTLDVVAAQGSGSTAQ